MQDSGIEVEDLGFRLRGECVPEVARERGEPAHRVVLGEEGGMQSGKIGGACSLSDVGGIGRRERPVCV